MLLRTTLNAFEFALNAGREVSAVLMALHVNGIHTGNAIVGMVAATTLFARCHTIDEIRLIDQCTRHLDGTETTVQHLLNARARNAAAHVDEWELDGFAHLQGIIEEIEVAIGLILYHQLSAAEAHAILQPPAIHIVSHGVDGHFAAHDVHRSLADETATENEGINAKTLQFLRNANAFGEIIPPLESITHIGLDYNGNFAVGSTQHLVDAEAHKLHTLIERAAPTVVAMIRVGGEKLTDEIAMTGMDFHTVEAGILGEAYGIAKLYCHLANLFIAHTANDGGRIEVEARIGRDWNLPCGAGM